MYSDLYESYKSIYKVNESVDYYATLIDYLLDEGYADCLENAEIIAYNMSDEWLNCIVEARSVNRDKNVSELSSDLATLRNKQRELQQRVVNNPEDSTARNALSQLMKQIKNASGARNQLASIQGVSSANISAPKASSRTKEDKLTPDEKAAFRSTSLRSSNVSPERKAELRASILAGSEKARKARYGYTPQTPSSGEKGTPTGETSKQRRASKAGDELVGNMDPTYYDRSTGQREKLKAVGATEVNYGGRGRARITGRYQQGSTGSGEQGTTPAGSTIDPTRRRLRGTGRSINR